MITKSNKYHHRSPQYWRETDSIPTDSQFSISSSHFRITFTFLGQHGTKSRCNIQINSLAACPCSWVLHVRPVLMDIPISDIIRQQILLHKSIQLLWAIHETKTSEVAQLPDANLCLTSYLHLSTGFLFQLLHVASFRLPASLTSAPLAFSLLWRFGLSLQPWWLQLQKPPYASMAPSGEPCWQIRAGTARGSEGNRRPSRDQVETKSWNLVTSLLSLMYVIHFTSTNINNNKTW